VRRPPGPRRHLLRGRHEDHDLDRLFAMRAVIDHNNLRAGGWPGPATGVHLPRIRVVGALWPDAGLYLVVGPDQASMGPHILVDQGPQVMGTGAEPGGLAQCGPADVQVAGHLANAGLARNLGERFAERVAELLLGLPGIPGRISVTLGQIESAFCRAGARHGSFSRWTSIPTTSPLSPLGQYKGSRIPTKNASTVQLHAGLAASDWSMLRA
jgi:hypothetical protein